MKRYSPGLDYSDVMYQGEDPSPIMSEDSECGGWVRLGDVTKLIAAINKWIEASLGSNDGCEEERAAVIDLVTEL